MCRPLPLRLVLRLAYLADTLRVPWLGDFLMGRYVRDVMRLMPPPMPVDHAAQQKRALMDAALVERDRLQRGEPKPWTKNGGPS